MKEYTKEELIGRTYIHKNDVAHYPKMRKMITDFKGELGNTIDLDTNTKGASDWWFTLKNANEWINDGVWILDEKKDQVINDYSIY